jgi:hypothetical protein
MVFRSTGQMHPEMMTTTFIESEMPIRSISTGTSTGGGTARKNSSTGSVRARSHVNDPIRRPPRMPRTMAAATPTKRRRRLGNTSERSRSPNHVLAKVETSVPGVGTKKLLAPRVEAHQIRTSNAGRARA